MGKRTNKTILNAQELDEIWDSVRTTGQIPPKYEGRLIKTDSIVGKLCQNLNAENVNDEIKQNSFLEIGLGQSVERRPLIINSDYHVSIANEFVFKSINTLSVNELKLLRLVIAQTKQGDHKLYPYELSALELAKALNISPKNLYRDLDKMTDNLLKAQITIKLPAQQRFKKYNLLSCCEYEDGKIYIKVNDDLSPCFLSLQKCFINLQIREYLKYKSKYSILILELLNAKKGGQIPHANVSVEIDISLDELREYTNTNEKYATYARFKSQVIDKAINELNEKDETFLYAATPYKNGRKIAGFSFLISSSTDYYKEQWENQRKNNVVKIINNQENKQMSLSDYFRNDY